MPTSPSLQQQLPHVGSDSRPERHHLHASQEHNQREHYATAERVAGLQFGCHCQHQQPCYQRGFNTLLCLTNKLPTSSLKLITKSNWINQRSCYIGIWKHSDKESSQSNLKYFAFTYTSPTKTLLYCILQIFLKHCSVMVVVLML